MVYSAHSISSLISSAASCQHFLRPKNEKIRRVIQCVCVCATVFRNSAILLSDTDKRSHSAYTFDTFFLTHIPAHISADVCIDCLLYATTDDGAGEVYNEILLRKKKTFETFVGCAISWLSLSSVFWRIYVVVVRQMSQCDGRQWVDSGHVIIFCCRLSPVQPSFFMRLLFEFRNLFMSFSRSVCWFVGYVNVTFVAILCQNIASERIGNILRKSVA